ncbi:flagellin [Haloterrigena alkaliphila]|nr:flagellin [Haloterrigena alkaliphila]QSW99197.2 flagellin [Haloterrigena alkaliphila]
MEGESNRERALMQVNQIDHAFATASISDEPQPLDVPSTADLTVSDDGSIEVEWFNADDSEADSCTVSGELRSLEYELEDRTFVHQGGGIWERSNGEATVVSEPQIGYDGESLQLHIMQLDEGDVGGSEFAAKADYSKSTQLTADIKSAATDCAEPDIAFRIESEYHQAWYTYLESALGAAEHDEVTVEQRNDTVEVTIEGVRNVSEAPEVIVTADYGLQGDAVVGTNRVIHPDEFNPTPHLEITAGFAKTVDEDIEQDLHFMVVGEGVSETIRNVQFNGDQDDEIRRPFRIAPGEYRHTLEPGQTYEYDISTADDSLSDRGSFYVGNEGIDFVKTAPENDDITTTTDDGNVTISLDVRNIGVESGSQDVTLTLDDFPHVTNTQSPHLEYGEDGTVEWTINQSALPVGEYDFTIDVDGEDVGTGTIRGEASSGEGGFVVVEDEGVDGEYVDRDQIVRSDGEFTVRAGIASTYPTDGVTEDVTLTIHGVDVEIPEPITLDGGERGTIAFDVDPDEYDLEPGTVYDYDVTTDDGGLSETGSFYFGHPDTHFALSNGNATVGDEVTIRADVHNTGIDDGSQSIDLDLEYQGELPGDLEEDPYADLDVDASDVDRSFGENGTIEFELNQSALIDGEYKMTIRSGDDSVMVPFTVTAGVDPNRVGLGEIEDAEVTVEVLGSQVSGDGLTGDHQLAPMTLEIIANGESIHAFENPASGNNINVGPTWQNKNDDSYRHEFTVGEETDLTLRNTRYASSRWNWWRQSPTCADQITDPSTLPHYTGPSQRDLAWCTNVPGTTAFGPIDASQGENLQNVRVRSAEDNSIPALPAGTAQQLSATEVLERQGLIAESGDELDLGPGEFVFLFENTESTNEDGIDALWNEAIGAYEENPSQTHDPNFNDLIVYVRVERAGVDPGTPSIRIVPGGGESTEVSSGDGTAAGEPGDVSVDVDGSSSGSGIDSIGPGTSSNESGNDGVASIDESDIDLSSDYIVVG